MDERGEVKDGKMRNGVVEREGMSEWETSNSLHGQSTNKIPNGNLPSLTSWIYGVNTVYPFSLSFSVIFFSSLWVFPFISTSPLVFGSKVDIVFSVSG